MRLVGFWLCAFVRTSVVTQSVKQGAARCDLSSSSSPLHNTKRDLVMPRRSNRKRSSTSGQEVPDNGETDSTAPNAPPKKRTTRPQRDATTTMTSATTPNDLCKSIVDNLHQHANPATRSWFENYVKGTTWVGCKLPMVRTCVQEIVPPIVKKKKKSSKQDQSVNEDHEASVLHSTVVLLDTAVQLLEQPACDVKLAGMLILSECFPVAKLTCADVLDRLERDVLQANKVNDWSSADWFASKVLRKIALESPVETRVEIVQRILDYTKDGTNLWYRRCGVVPFVQYYNHRAVLPDDMGARLIQACEQSLLASPTERFTQTGVAWVLRYMLSRQTATPAEREAAAAMIVSHPSLWNAEAKKSLTEKLTKSDPLRDQILKLQ